MGEPTSSAPVAPPAPSTTLLAGLGAELARHLPFSLMAPAHVELFVRGDRVWFSEVSPRPHDTGLVTLISQDLSEFALHARAILGLPIPNIRSRVPAGDAEGLVAASCALLVEGDSSDIRFEGVERALTEPDTMVRLFGKPEVRGKRRMGVALPLDTGVEAARAKARRACERLLRGVCLA